MAHFISKSIVKEYWYSIEYIYKPQASGHPALALSITPLYALEALRAPQASRSSEHHHGLPMAASGTLQPATEHNWVQDIGPQPMWLGQTILPPSDTHI